MRDCKLETWTLPDRRKVSERLSDYSLGSETTFLFAEGFIAFAWILIAPQKLLVMLTKWAILELMACNTYYTPYFIIRPVVSNIQVCNRN